MRNAEESAVSLPSQQPALSTWSCPGPRRALYALSVAIRLRDPDEALRAAEIADAAWAAGEPWLYGVWALVRIGAATAHVMKGDLDAAAGQLRAVMALAPLLRISPITRYLADMDALLAQPRFGGNTVAADMRNGIRSFSDAAAPATCGDGDGR